MSIITPLHIANEHFSYIVAMIYLFILFILYIKIIVKEQPEVRDKSKWSIYEVNDDFSTLKKNSD